MVPFFEEQSNEIIRQVLLGKTMLGKAASKEVLDIINQLNFENWGILEGDAAEIIEKLLADAGIQALAQLGISDDALTTLVNEKAVEYAKERAAELVTRISEATRNMIRADVTQALDEGWSNDKLSEVLADNYAFSEERANMIARTETAYADVAGNLLGYRLSGVVAQKQWITGAGCCDLCDELNGVVIGIDEEFDTEDGPIDGPPYHPNCRCDVLPIVDNDVEQPEEQ
jgi:SPP1 gp7 family putative phage head morphogenesis protein